jgi:hypothetical protein
MDTSKPRLTPLDARQLKDIISEPIENKPYRALIGCLMYACLATRPDLCIAVNFYSQYQSKATKAVWEGLKRILRYIQGTKNWGLWYKNQSETVLVGYADADYANSVDRKSVTGYLFKMYGNLIIWTSRKQRTVALSSTEAEFISLASAAAEYLWVKQMLKEMRVYVQEPVVLYEDNQACIHSLVSWDQRRLKHVDIKYTFIRDLVKSKSITVKYIESANQTADIFTKGLPYELFKAHRTELGMCELK